MQLCLSRQQLNSGIGVGDVFKVGHVAVYNLNFRHCEELSPCEPLYTREIEHHDRSDHTHRVFQIQAQHNMERL